MLIIYTGNGKGKTSACVGQALRALGRGFAVEFVQFMKTPDIAGEQKLLGQLLGSGFTCAGQGFYFGDKNDFPKQRATAQELLLWVTTRLAEQGSKGQGRMLIMDEALYALSLDLITKSELCSIIDQCLNLGIHLVLSGRGLPDWLAEKADLISDIQEVKHPMRSGIAAGAGIEF